MENNRIEHLESRVEKLEDDIKTLASLPMKLDMLITLQKEQNENTKELSAHITNTYASKEICMEKHKNIDEDIKELKDFRKWVYASLISGAGVIILELMKFIGGR